MQRPFNKNHVSYWSVSSNIPVVTKLAAIYLISSMVIDVMMLFYRESNQSLLIKFYATDDTCFINGNFFIRNPIRLNT